LTDFQDPGIVIYLKIFVQLSGIENLGPVKALSSK